MFLVIKAKEVKIVKEVKRSDVSPVAMFCLCVCVFPLFAPLTLHLGVTL